MIKASEARAMVIEYELKVMRDTMAMIDDMIVRAARAGEESITTEIEDKYYQKICKALQELGFLVNSERDFSTELTRIVIHW